MIRALSILLLLGAIASAQPVPIVPASTNAPKGRDVTVEWNSASDATVRGYAIYSGLTGNGAGLTNRTDVGMNTSATLTNIFPPIWFYAVSYNAAGVESLPSNLAAWLGDTNDIYYFEESAATAGGPFQDKTLLTVKSNAAGLKFTRLQIEARKRKVTLP